MPTQAFHIDRDFSSAARRADGLGRVRLLPLISLLIIELTS
jgi:hypothetical protein